MHLLRTFFRPLQINQTLFKVTALSFALSLSGCGAKSEAEANRASLKQISGNAVSSETPTCTVDRFRQPSPPVSNKVDVLFVVDNSKSMYRHWQLMAKGIGKLIHQLPKDQDIRFGVVLGTITKFPGVLFSAPRVPKVLDGKKLSEEQIVENLKKTFAYAMEYDNVDWKGAGEALFYSLYYAVTSKAVINQKQGFFRADAALSVIFMSDDAEEGYPYPSKQVWDLPPKCNWTHHDKMRKTFYLPRGIDTDSTFAALKRLKGDMPLVTNAFVNITKEDILVDNDPHAHCIFDSPGFGYFDIVKRTNGVLYSIHKNREKGLEIAGRLLKNRLDLLHDFKLSKPTDKVDPASIQAKVDSKTSPHTYFADTNVVHLDDAGQAGSLIEIQHCEPIPQPVWTISGFTGQAGQTTAALQWNTNEYPTKGKVLFGVAPDAMNDSVTDPNTGKSHSVSLVNLNPNTTYYFQVVASDEFGAEKRSEIISLRTQPNWLMGQVSGQASRNSASLSWNTKNYPTTGKVLWGTAPDQLSQSSADTAASVDHVVTINGLQPSTVYYFQAVSHDEFGLVKASPVLSLTTAPDWAIVGFAGKASRSTASLTWQTPEEITSSQLLYGLAPNALTETVNDPQIGNTHGANLSGLEPNTDYYFQAQAKDQNGNIKQSPVISLHTLNDWAIANLSSSATDTTISVSFTTTGYSTNGTLIYGLSADQLSNSVDAGAASEIHDAAITGLKQNTTYYLQAVAVDDLQVERRSAVFSVTTKATVDPLPKWVIGQIDGSATTNSITVQWQTAEYPTTGVLLWGTSPEALTNSANDPISGKTHSLTLNSLNPDTFYYFQIVASDDRGQQQASSVIPVRTQALPLPAWSITDFAGLPRETSIAIQWNTADYPTVGKVRWGTTSTNLNQSTPVETTAGTAHPFTISGLNANTTYYFQAVSTDDRGQTKTSNVISVQTLPPPLPSWQITDFAGTAAVTSVNLSWNTADYPTVGKVRWGTTSTNLNQSTPVETTAGTAHPFTISGLNADTTYYFQAVSTDDRGQTKTSNVISVQTLPLPLPTWEITGLNGVPLQTSVSVSWDTSGYPTVGKVLWGLNSSSLDHSTDLEIDPSNAHGFTISGLNADTTYYFQAVSTDDRGQTKTSNVISVRTLPLPLPSWQITDFAGTAAASWANLSWNTTEYPTVGKVLWGTSSTNLDQSTPVETTAGTAHPFTISGLNANTTYYFQAVSTDDRGQTKTSNVIAIKTLVIPPTWSIVGFDGTTTTNQANLIWQTPSRATKATLRVGLSASDLSLRQIDVPTFDTSHLLTVSGLNANTTYFFQVVAQDSDGGVVESSIISKKTKTR